MERPEENQDAPKKPEEKETSPEDLLGFLEWYKDPAATPREKQLLEKTIGEIVKKEFEKMVDEDPSLRAAFESLPTEMTVTPLQSEAAELAYELQKSPEKFFRYLQWLYGILHTFDPKRFSPDDPDLIKITDTSRTIQNAEHTESLNKKDILAMKVFLIRHMKKILRQNGIRDDLLTKEAFQKWSQSKPPPRMGGGGQYIT
ncbi:MAG: hypothetical protein Q7R73_00705 [bacterium]|nr:hypothetical protein [bacterium]